MDPTVLKARLMSEWSVAYNLLIFCESYLSYITCPLVITQTRDVVSRRSQWLEEDCRRLALWISQICALSNVIKWSGWNFAVVWQSNDKCWSKGSETNSNRNLLLAFFISTLPNLKQVQNRGSLFVTSQRCIQNCCFAGRSKPCFLFFEDVFEVPNEMLCNCKGKD